MEDNILNTVKVEEIKAPLIKDLGDEKAEIIDEVVSIKEVLALHLFEMIQELEYKIKKGRIKDKEAEKIKIEYLKVYVNACNTFNNITKDTNAIYNKDVLKKFFSAIDKADKT